MRNELMKFVEDKESKCKNKKDLLVIRGILTGMTLCARVKDKKTLDKVKELFDEAVKEIVKGG